VVSTGAHVPPSVTNALLIGVDLGPNLSVTGSLATILWLVAIRRDGEDISAWRFLRVGVFVMVPALVLALATSILGYHYGR
jgi:arsenical pump membrane protein